VYVVDFSVVSLLKMPASRVARLEDLVTHFGRSPSEGGALFVELCVELLKVMGFSDIYIRKGTESGRDIDAKWHGQVWFFECKRYTKTIKTPEMAYKFLQLDVLPESLQPDFFVLFSNASMKSILKDIIEFKKSDRNVRYSVEAWVNEPSNAIFESILLSYPKTYVEFVKTKLKPKGKWFSKLLSDFRVRSRAYLRTNPKFFDGILESIAVIRQASLSKPLEPSSKFFLDHTLKVTKRLMGGHSWTLLLIGCPVHPISGLYDFANYRSVKSLVDVLAKWEVVFVKKEGDCLIFGENWGNRTLLFDYGAIVTLTDLSSLDTPAFTSQRIEPWEWLQALREDSLRMRNFSKKGMLITPAVFQAHIIDLMHLPSDKTDFAKFGTLERFMPNVVFSKSRRGDVKVSHLGIHSDALTLNGPPEMHDEIGRPLAESLYREIGIPDPLLDAAKTIKTKLLKESHRKCTNNGKGLWFDPFFDCQFSFFESLGWLLDGEVFDRSYGYFEKKLKA
jgi:hypothetical protein